MTEQDQPLTDDELVTDGPTATSNLTTGGDADGTDGDSTDGHDGDSQLCAVARDCTGGAGVQRRLPTRRGHRRRQGPGHLGGISTPAWW